MMANLPLQNLLVLVLATCGSRALNPTFDKDTLGLQVILTDWKNDQSVRDLVTEVQNQIPMNLSTACKAAVHEWVFDLIRKEPYAISMVDAFGKVPAGLLLGHILIFGHFDQCLSIKKFSNETGQLEPAANYCLTRLKHPEIEKKLPVLPAYGVCLPLACANYNDSNAFVSGLFKPLRAAQDLEAVQGVCANPMPKTTGLYIMITLLTVIAVVLVAASFVDYIYRRRYKKSNAASYLNDTDANDIPVYIYERSNTINNNGHTVTTQQYVEETERKPKYGYANVPAFLKPLLCWNLMTNFRSILSPVAEGEISFLHGFRVLSMWWIILGHTYLLGKNFFENQITFFGDVRTAGFQIILNSGYAVDSFFLLSGLLIAYVLFRDLVRNDGKLNWCLVYVHRYWRLTPVYVFVMLVYVHIVPHGIGGPFKLLIAQLPALPTDHCKIYWWTNVLYINNFFPVFRMEQCMNWTWFLALDMQFFLITPLLVFILYKSRNAGLAVIGAIVVASVATTMGIIGYYGLPVHWFQEPLYSSEDVNVTILRNTSDLSSTGRNFILKTGTGYNKHIDYIYEKPYTRIAPFVIGIVLGYFFVNRPAEKPTRRLIGVVGWILSLAIAIPLLFGFHFAGWYAERPPQEMSVTARILYGGLQRLGWSLVVGWILFACQYGYAGPVRSFLGSRFWRPLSKLTYGAYLVHMLVLQYYFGSQRHMIFYSLYNMVTIFVAQLVMAYGVALLIAVLVEVPLLRLERLVVSGSL